MAYQYYHIDYGKPDPGSRIEDVPTYADVLKADGDPLPPVFAEVGNHQPAPRLITYDRYYSPEIYAMEIEKIWKKQWQLACREEDIPNVGDRIAYDVAEMSYVVVRTAADEFKAFHNSCRHRGRKLCDDKGSGKHLQCAFHGWTYGLDGKLKWIPFEQEFPDLNRENYSLHQVKVARWGGNVFINPDPNAPAFESTLGPLARHYDDCPQGDRYTAISFRKKVRANWKAAQEAFNEAYHVVETHADGMPMFGSALTQIDCWEEGNARVNRLITPGMVVDPYINDRVSTHEGLRVFCSAYGFEAPPEDRGQTAPDARKYAAEQIQKRLEESTGRSYAGRPASYFLDMTKYVLFPNFHPWWGEMLPWWYRFLPLGPEECTMEVRVLLPHPANGEVPPAAKRLEIDFDEMGKDFPELGPLGHLVDQDMSNMVAVQKGFKAAAKGEDFITLAPRAEAQIAHFYEIYDEIMGFDGN
jgi:phenylpropionate dioxygenase-like ring-hydroxylating dioxygenase large terminal subunit